MFKRNCFVILAGLIAGAALLGWSPKIEGLLAGQSEGDAAQVAKQNIAKAEEFGGKVSELLNTSDGERLAVLSQMAENDQVQGIKGGGKAVPLKLLSPEVAPDVDVSKSVKISLDPLKDALKALQKNDDLQPYGHVAVFDFAGKKILESDDADAALAQVEKFVNTSEKGSGTVFINDEDGALRLMWHCLDEGKNNCLFLSEQRDMEIDKAIRCGAVQNGMLTCGEENVELVSIFGKGSCTIDAAHKAVMEALGKQSDANGMLKIGEKEFAFVKSDLESGCKLSVAFPVEVNENGGGGLAALTKPLVGSVSLLALGMSVLGCVIVIVLGFVMTKRRKEDEKGSETTEQPADNSQAANNLETARQLEEARNNLAKATQENEGLRAQVQSLMAEVEHAKQAAAAMPPRPATPAPAVPPTPAAPAPAAPAVPPTPAPATPSAAPAESEGQNVSAEGNGNANEFVDGLEKDNWSELSESFDSIQSPQTGEAVIEEDGAEPVENASDGVGGAEAVAEPVAEVKAPVVEPPQQAAPGVVKPALPTPPASKLGGISGMRPLASSVTAPSPRTTIPGIRSVDGPALSASALNPTVQEEKPGLPGLKPSGVKLPQKPGVMPPIISPSDVGIIKPGVQEARTLVQPAVDQEALVDALKKHAKDVSEVNPPVPGEPSTSGAFDFNQGISKSGDFSVTGSRVDVDPESESEYFKSVYEQFIEMQKSCGEQTKFTLEQFMTRLSREKERLMKSYKCKTVRFNVYVKDGKTSLKAVPQK